MHTQLNTSTLSHRCELCLVLGFLFCVFLPFQSSGPSPCVTCASALITDRPPFPYYLHVPVLSKTHSVPAVRTDWRKVRMQCADVMMSQFHLKDDSMMVLYLVCLYVTLFSVCLKPDVSQRSCQCRFQSQPSLVLVQTLLRHIDKKTGCLFSSYT